MNDFLVISPILIPLTMLILCLGLEMRGIKTDAVAFTGVGLMLAAATMLVVRVAGGGALTMEMGGWEPPYGIVVVADLLAALMVWISAFVVLMVLVYGVKGRAQGHQGGHAHVLIMGLLLGVNGSFLTGDLFNRHRFPGDH